VAKRSVTCIARLKAVVRLIDLLAPYATPRQRKRLADKILSLFDEKDRSARMTPQLLSELIAIHSSCVHDQEGKCPLLVSTSSLCWEINNAIGCGNEEDKAFKRHDPMCAARPLTVRFDREEG
jgi:hypothetical protein